MKRETYKAVIIFSIIVSLAIGGFVGFFLGVDASIPDPETSHDEAHVHDDGSLHVHTEVLELDDPASVSLEVLEDPAGGFNAKISTTNFRFAPELVSTDHVEGTGHAHIYVDDVKIGRMYGEWFQIGALNPGTRHVRVTLNANSHEELSFAGELVQDSVMVVVE